jgi:predicted metal-dependent hydrolase
LEEAERTRLMAEGRAAFNRAEFYEAHEHWEEVWDVADDPARTWVQGLIQVATGLHKLAGGRPDVCTTLLARALTKLMGAPEVLWGVSLADASTGAERALASIRAGSPIDPASVRLGACAEAPPAV